MTSKLIYDDLSNRSGDFDYSGVCLLLTKALENECKSRFYKGYLKYMSKNYGNNTNNYPLWFISRNLKNHHEVLLSENEFTLGTMAYATGYLKRRDDNSDLFLTMNDYCYEELFINKDEKYIASTLRQIGQQVNEVTNSFRNPAAHIQPMSKIKAEECFKYLIEVQKLIQKILLNCKY